MRIGSILSGRREGARHPSLSEPDGDPPWRARLLGALWATLLRLQAATWRVEVEGLGRFDADLEAGRGAVVAFWHGTYVPLFFLLRDREAVAFTSRSFRGWVIAEICRRFGYRAVRIPDRGRKESLEIMREVLWKSRAAGIAVDGPLGPRHRVKRGTIQLASELGWRVYPTAVASSRKKVFPDRWDRREVPRLFSRVAAVLGEPLEVPPEITDHGPWRERLGAALGECERRAEELLKDTAGNDPGA